LFYHQLRLLPLNTLLSLVVREAAVLAVAVLVACEPER
jgi:hypothetical protein